MSDITDVVNNAEYKREGFSAIGGNVSFIYKLDVKHVKTELLKEVISYLVFTGYTVRLLTGSNYLYWGA